MRKSLIITTLLLALSAFIILGSHVSLNSIKDKVLVEETVIYGDKAKVDDITITNRSHYDYHLYWNTSYTIGNERDAKTEFNFYQSRKQEEHTPEYRIYLYPNLDFSMSSSGGIDLESELQFPNKAIIDVASRTKAGETREETVFFKDYYEFYPLMLDSSTSIVPIETMYDGEETNYGNYFKIPVPPDHTVKISITKNEAAEVSAISCSSVENEAEIYASGTVTNDGCYIAISAKRGYPNNEAIPLSEDILGIHYLPFKEKKPTAILHTFDMEKAKLVYPIDNKKCKILEIKKSTDDTKLLLFTKESDAIFLSVIDIKTMKLLQKISLHKSNDPGLWEIKQYDNFIVLIFSNEEFCLIADENGTYNIKISDSFVKYGKIVDSNSYYNMVVEFDGNKMVAVTYSEPYKSLNNIVLVYDSSGLIYAGEYALSLSSKDNISNIVRPTEGDFLRVNFD